MEQLPAGWETAFDERHSATYYFNRSLGISQWTPPSGTEPASQPSTAPSTSQQHPQQHAVHSDTSHATAHAWHGQSTGTMPQWPGQYGAPHAQTLQQATPQHQTQQASRAGLYYKDPYGRVQGPFSQEHLHSWRPYLPMDMLVWMLDEEDFLQGEQDDGETQGREPPEQQVQQQEGQQVHDQQQEEQQGHDQQQEQQGQQQEGQQDRGSGKEPGARQEEQQDKQQVSDDGICLQSEGHHAAPCKDHSQDSDAMPSVAASTAQPNADLAATPAASDGTLSLQLSREHPADGSADAQPLQLSVPQTHTTTTGDTGTAALPQPSRKRAHPEDAPPASYSLDQLLEAMPAVELAELVGDGVLLADWRAQRAAGFAPPTPHAPPAPIWEHWLLYGPRSRPAAPVAAVAVAAPAQAAGACVSVPQREMGDEVDDEGGAAGQQDSRLAYAEAVLAGLPADDEAVVISQLALGAGKTLQDVIDFSYKSNGTEVAGPAPIKVDYTTAIRNPHNGRLTAAGADEVTQSYAATLYGEMSGWCNPEELEKSLQEASQRRGQVLPPHIWKRLKERKMQVKKKMRAMAML